VRSLTWLARLGLVVAAGALLTTSVAVAIAPRLWHAANAHEEEPIVLPRFQPLAQRSRVYDRNGDEIAIYEAENSQPIALSKVPQHVIDAFLAVEDKEFFRHHGVNFRSLVRAALSNFSSDAPQQGASTITMQVVKNDFLAGLERDGRYKLLQTHYALMLERRYTKSQILQRYLNTVFFGNNAYGIQAAAEVYFGKTAPELTFTEAVFLAGLVRAPSAYDPINEPERSRARFIQVLDRLADDDYYTHRQATRIGRDFVLPERVRTTPQRTHARTYYTEALRDYLLNMTDILGATYEERYAALYRGGLRIHTTFDPDLQAKAEAARNILPPTPQGFEAAIASLDTQNGAIRAMVGGPGWTPENQVNMALAPRQTGSAQKFIILAAALQAGVQPLDIIDGTTPCTLPNPGDPTKPFEITDAVSRGPSTVAEMTWASINCAYARLSQIVGLSRVVDMAYRLAESAYLYKGQPPEEHPEIEPHASFATGANEFSPLDMASAMQTVLNEGMHHQPYYIEYIDKGPRRLYTHEDKGTRIIDRRAALAEIDVLKKVLTEGTASRYPLEGRTSAGKTGTQLRNTNAWFVGGTPQLSTAVWMGDPDAYTSMDHVPEFAALGHTRVQGGRIPTLIWKTYMDPAHALLPAADWPAPPKPARPPARLYLPGNECLRVVVGHTPEQRIPGTTAPAPGGPGPGGPGPGGPGPDGPGPGGDEGAAGFAMPQQQPPPGPPETTPNPTTPAVTTTTAPAPPPDIVIPSRPIYQTVEGGTTIPPHVLDPRAPVPSVPLGTSTYPC
jgi:penicillin-binding protein 1A